MAKRKSTDKTSKTEAEDHVDTNAVPGPDEPSDTPSSDMDTAQDAVDAVDAYAPEEKSADADADTVEGALTDDRVEQQEPAPEQEGAEASDETTDAPEETDVSERVEGDTPDDHISEEEARRLIKDAETVEDHGAQSETVEDHGAQSETVEDHGAQSETVEDREAEPDRAPDTPPVPVAPQVIRETTVERKGGFFPMLLGGVVAAGLGYGVAAYVSQDLWPFAVAEDTGFEDEVRNALTEQDGTLSDLGTRIATLEDTEPPTVDMSPLEAQIAALQSTASDLSARMDDMAGRIDTLERQPMEQAVSPEAIAAYERALAELQSEVEAQRAEVALMAEQAVAAEGNAEEQARLAASRTALADITSALDTGESFAGAVSILSANGVEVPAALADTAETGVPTLSGLVESFPDAARAALSEARRVAADSSDGAGRVATFFANQLGARSVAPREGDDPDAVLSRAEASVRAGDLQAALTELSALPPEARTAVSDWQTRAQTRLEAKTAADTLVQRLIQE